MGGAGRSGRPQVETASVLALEHRHVRNLRCGSNSVRPLLAADPAQRDVDKEVSPEFFAQMMMVLHMPLAEYRANGDSRPVTIAGLEGKARKIGIRSSDGRFHEAIILSASRDCLYLTAIVAAADDREIPLERIDALSSAFDIRRYGPLPDPCPEDIPLLEKLQERPGCPWAASDGK